MIADWCCQIGTQPGSDLTEVSTVHYHRHNHCHLDSPMNMWVVHRILHQLVELEQVVKAAQLSAVRSYDTDLVWHGRIPIRNCVRLRRRCSRLWRRVERRSRRRTTDSKLCLNLNRPDCSRSMIAAGDEIKPYWKAINKL
jgi:hypothetical protein